MGRCHHKLNEQILKYLSLRLHKPHAQTVYADNNVSILLPPSKYIPTMEKGRSGLAGETNATLKITDANATLHGNYSVVVSNDFSVESMQIETLYWLGVHQKNQT